MAGRDGESPGIVRVAGGGATAGIPRQSGPPGRTEACRPAPPPRRGSGSAPSHVTFGIPKVVQWQSQCPRAGCSVPPSEDWGCPRPGLPAGRRPRSMIGGAPPLSWVAWPLVLPRAPLARVFSAFRIAWALSRTGLPVGVAVPGREVGLVACIRWRRGQGCCVLCGPGGFGRAARPIRSGI